MGMRRQEFGLSSAVNRLLAGAGAANPPPGLLGLNWNLVTTVWQVWTTVWGYSWSTEPTGIVWNNWTELWGK